MRKFMSNKKNPNPPWPFEQPIVVVPEGTSPAAIGIDSEKTHKMPLFETPAPPLEDNPSQDVSPAWSECCENADENRTEQIMDYRQQGLSRSEENNLQSLNQSAPSCASPVYINNYLCEQIGRYVKVEFLFGEQTHVEKTGILEKVGKNFIVIKEDGFNNMLVASVNNIKFINVYSPGGKTL